MLGPGERAGTVRDALPLRAGVLVGAGTGDNAAAALGLGLTPGRAVLSLGTSGTVYTVARRRPTDTSGTVAGFAAADGGWLPLACTLNCTLAVDKVAALLGRDREDVEDGGSVAFLPFLDGERTPNLPYASGLLTGLRHDTTSGQVLQAAYDGAVYALLGALDQVLAVDGGSSTDEPLLLIGGGARGAAWLAHGPPPLRAARPGARGAASSSPSAPPPRPPLSSPERPPPPSPTAGPPPPAPSTPPSPATTRPSPAWPPPCRSPPRRARNSSGPRVRAVFPHPQPPVRLRPRLPVTTVGPRPPRTAAGGVSVAEGGHGDVSWPKAAVRHRLPPRVTTWARGRLPVAGQYPRARAIRRWGPIHRRFVAGIGRISTAHRWRHPAVGGGTEAGCPSCVVRTAAAAARKGGRVGEWAEEEGGRVGRTYWGGPRKKAAVGKVRGRRRGCGGGTWRS